ncbi:caspase-8-like isoform X2 [Pagrus major]|uniref:caspase-8-like isoform X2 n=1 Tax=Pagrus major TaxID=143350 RepID=UPI003CC8C9FE
MADSDTVRRNKTAIQTILCADHRLILNKVDEKRLITRREYNNLKTMKEDVEGLINELVDKIMDKGDDTCQAFLDLLQTDEEIKDTYPELKKIQWTNTSHLLKPLQESCQNSPSQERRKQKQYQLNSKPTGLCVIINNENFADGRVRHGTDKDAESLAEVFSWLGFRVVMCKDQTRDQMDRALKCLASLSNLSQLQEFSIQEWSGSEFTDLQEAPKHGDAFICSILSHGESGVVLGTDGKPLSIKHITRTFKATDQSALTGKPKVFLIQASQKGGSHCENRVHPSSNHVEADVVVAIATVEGHDAYSHRTTGSLFIQSVCQQLKKGCLRGEDITTVFHHVINEVSAEKLPRRYSLGQQIPEVRYTLKKTLVFSPCHS